jgi:hypothetical protein
MQTKNGNKESEDTRQEVITKDGIVSILVEVGHGWYLDGLQRVGMEPSRLSLLLFTVIASMRASMDRTSKPKLLLEQKALCTNRLALMSNWLHRRTWRSAIMENSWSLDVSWTSWSLFLFLFEPGPNGSTRLTTILAVASFAAACKPPAEIYYIRFPCE